MAFFCIPCEVFQREFDAKLLLSIRLASEYGHTALIGYDKYFTQVMPDLHDVILVDKSMSSIMYKARIRHAKKNGGKIIICDEEGFNTLGYRDTKSFLARVDQRALECVDLYAAWGSREIDFYKVIPGFADKALVLGNARSDLLNHIGSIYFQKIISSISNIFSPYILISDNFAVEPLGLDRMPRYDISESQYAEIQGEYDSWKVDSRILRDHMRALLDYAIRKLPGIQFVLRPHPAANPLWWHQRFGEYRNCHVIHRFPVEPWILASTAVVNMGCTVGVQAILAGKPTVEVASSGHPLHGTSSRLVSNHVYTKQELLDSLVNILSGKRASSIDNDYLRYSWANTGLISSTSILASKFNRIAADLPSSLQDNGLQRGVFNYDRAKWSELPSFHSIKSRVIAGATALQLNPPGVKKISDGVFLIRPKSS